eukprot:jgi/Bigna1/133672/aug1.22_g8380
MSSLKMPEQHVLLRATPELAEKLNQMFDDNCDETSSKEGLEPIEIEFTHTRGDKRMKDMAEGGIFQVGKERYEFDVKDLPCLLECCRTYNGEHVYKTGDISQILHVRRPGEKPAREIAAARKAEKAKAGRRSSAAADRAEVARLRKEIEEKINDPYKENSGITPPTRHIRIDRFRYPPVPKQKVKDVVRVMQHMIAVENGVFAPFVERELVEVAV